MEQPVEQPCFCDVWLCGKRKRMCCVNILIIKMYQMNFCDISKT